MKSFSNKSIFLAVAIQTILSFVAMDINGPFFIIKNKHAYNPTNVITILTWNRHAAGWVLLGFAINLPILLVLNILVWKLWQWMRERMVGVHDFFVHILSVVLIYLVVVVFWWVVFGSRGAEKYYFHPLGVLLGVGFFVSNILFFSIWYLYLLARNKRVTS